jgi:hypothetical protein
VLLRVLLLLRCSRLQLGLDALQRCGLMHHDVLVEARGVPRHQLLTCHAAA